MDFHLSFFLHTHYNLKLSKKKWLKNLMRSAASHNLITYSHHHACSQCEWITICDTSFEHLNLNAFTFTFILWVHIPSSESVTGWLLWLGSHLLEAFKILRNVMLLCLQFVCLPVSSLTDIFQIFFDRYFSNIFWPLFLKINFDHLMDVMCKWLLGHWFFWVLLTIMIVLKTLFYGRWCWGATAN